MEPIIIVIILVCLVVGTILDFKTREIPDWINYGMILGGIVINLMFWVAYSDYRFIVHSLFGLLVCFLISCVLYYSGQWGGGDAKMLMGMGSLIGIPVTWPALENVFLWFGNFPEMPVMFLFVIYMLAAGAVYGLIWTLGLAVLNRKEWQGTFKKHLSSKQAKLARMVVIIIAGLFVGLGLIYGGIVKYLCLMLALIVLIGFYMFYFIRSIEKVSMIKMTPIEKLTEGDWIVDDVKVKGKVIVGPKDLGISKEQIEALLKFKEKGLIEKVKVKEGIPFVPSFLIAFLMILIWGADVLGLLIGFI